MLLLRNKKEIKEEEMKKVQIGKIYVILKKGSEVETKTRDPFKVLVSTILSARTKDKTTTEASNRLFKKIKDINGLERISENELKKLIYPVGFYNTKAKNLKKLPKVLKEKFDNKIPCAVEELVHLPGVGRKTANLVVAVAFKKPAICVDTHVHRIMNRVGYVKTKNPHETEIALRKKLPKKYWTTINTILVAFGQNLCKPISPHCSVCPIAKYCNMTGIKRNR